MYKPPTLSQTSHGRTVIVFVLSATFALSGCRTTETNSGETSTGLKYRAEGAVPYVENPGIYAGEKSGYPVKPVR